MPQIILCFHGVASIVTRLWAERPGFHSPRGRGKESFSSPHRLDLLWSVTNPLFLRIGGKVVRPWSRPLTFI